MVIYFCYWKGNMMQCYFTCNIWDEFWSLEKWIILKILMKSVVKLDLAKNSLQQIILIEELEIMSTFFISKSVYYTGYNEL